MLDQKVAFVAMIGAIRASRMRPLRGSQTCEIRARVAGALWAGNI
jgi:hypothetical protein